MIECNDRVVVIRSGYRGYVRQLKTMSAWKFGDSDTYFYTAEMFDDSGVLILAEHEIRKCRDDECATCTDRFRCKSS
jgi:hypothetical protein